MKNLTPTGDQSNSGVPISKGLLLINSLSGVAAKVINLLLLLWLQQYLIRRIPTEEYSLYPVFVSISMFMLTAKAVFTGGIARYLIAARANNDNQRITEIASTTFVLNSSIALFIFIIGLPVAFSIENFLKIDPEYYRDARIIMALVLTSFCLKLAFATFESGLIVEQRFVTINIINVSMTVLRLLLLFIFVVGVSPRVLWVVIATEAANMTSLLLFGIMSKKHIPALRIKLNKIRKKTVKAILSFGVWSFVGQLANRIRTAADPIILNQMAGSFTVTIYYIGSLIPRNIYQIVQHATQAILPSLTAMYETGQGDKLSRTYIRYGRVLTWILLFVGLPFMVLHREIMSLYAGSEYAKAGTVLLILLIAEAIEQSYSGVVKLAIASAKMKTLSILSLITQAFNLTLTLVLVGFFKYGAVGAAASTLITRIALEYWVFSIYGAKLAGVTYLRWFKGAFLRGIIPFIVGIPVMMLLKRVWIPENWLHIFLQACIGIIVYLIVMIGFSAGRADRKDMKRLINWIRSKMKKERN
ncbi:MAG: lipopolysaccharide biosynthesis protein [bacterium]